MRVTLPDGIATGGGTTKFRDVFVEPGTNAQRLFRKNNQAAIDTPWSDAPAELGIAPDGGAHNPADPRLTWFSDTQVNLDLFDVVRNVTGPLTFSFSYYKIMPQLDGPAPTIERGPINAAYPPAAPDPAPNTLRVASFNVENYFPVGKENDGHVDHAGRVQRAHGRDRERDPQPPQGAGRDRRAGGRGVRRRRQRADRPRAGARQLHGRTSRPTTTAAGSRPGFLVKNGTTAANGRVLGEERPTAPWGSDGRRATSYPGTLFDRAPYALDVKKGDIALTVLSNHFASQSHQNACRISEAEYVRQQAADDAAGGQERARRG